MIIGAITNSWREHLVHTDLPRLVARVQNRGAAHIELRQTCLGQYESGGGDEWRPDTERLERLYRTFPVMSFNLAVAYPCLTREPDPEAPMFQACLEAAKAVNPVTPRLRLVDTAQIRRHLEGGGRPAAGRRRDRSDGTGGSTPGRAALPGERRPSPYVAWTWWSGFAVTLCLGIGINLFTALIGTKVVFDLVNRRKIESLSI